MTLLLCDGGNTAIKCAWLDRPEDVIWSGAPDQFTDQFTQAGETIIQQSSGVVAVCSSPRAEQTIRTTLGRFTDKTCAVVGAELALPDLGQYETCGADRVLAGYAVAGLIRKDHDAEVFDASSRHSLVIDAGTATTLTAWSIGMGDHASTSHETEARGGVPRFMGGLIAPGAAACLQGLAQAAPGLQPLLATHTFTDFSATLFDQSSLQSLPQALSHNSADAMLAAMALGYPGMIQSCLLAMLAQLPDPVQIIITGGQAEFLMDRLELEKDQPMQLEPALVRRGLARLWLNQ